MQQRQPVEGDAEHLVERRTRVPTAVASSESCGQKYLLCHLYPRPSAEALEQELVEQAGADQRRIIGRNVAEIVVIKIELHPWVSRHAHCEETAPEARTRRWRCRGPGGAIELCRLVHRKAPAVGDRVFKKHKGTVHRPVDHVDARSRRAAVVPRVILTAGKIDESAADYAVRAVIP